MTSIGAMIRQSPLHLSVGLFIALACASLTGLNIKERMDARSARLAQATTDDANLARSLAQHVQDSFQTADAMLIGLRERFEQDGTAPAALARLESLMRLRVRTVPQLHGLFLFDAEGNWLANSVPGTQQGLNYADRDYFAFHRDHPQDTVLIGRPIRSRADNSWIITVTRRLFQPDGRFAGVVDATVATDLFQRFYETFDLGHGGVITLVNDDGVVLVRRPFNERNIGRNIASSQLFQLVSHEGDASSFEFTGTVDGKVRIGSFHRIPGLHLRVLVSREKAEILEPWWQETRINLIWLAAVLGVVALLGHRIAIQVRTRVQAERLYRLLADNSGDAIICTGQDGTRRYVSPSFWTMTGWSEAALLGQKWDGIIPPEDHPILEEVMADLAAGAPEARATYRYICADGSLLWVEICARVASRVPGQPIEFVGNIRDISRQKAAEDRLADANVALAAMTMTDALTGIANRRHFDATLRREWNRARRAGSTLALLMIDADHFKRYNDTYGHVLGDACLSRIAGVLTANIRRPGDLAARYGGEEFAIILSDTPADKAAQLAERIRQALSDAAIAHSGNAGGIVTVSIGVAALVPQRNTAPDLLVLAADQALYAAKHAGRNRVSTAGTDPPAPLLAAE